VGTGETALAALVRRNGEASSTYRPLPDGKPPLSRMPWQANTPELVPPLPSQPPAASTRTRHDYRRRQVLVTSRGFDKAPWTLMYTIERAEALDATQERLQWLTAFRHHRDDGVAVACRRLDHANSLRRAESAAVIASWRASGGAAQSASPRNRQSANRNLHPGCRSRYCSPTERPGASPASRPTT